MKNKSALTLALAFVLAAFSFTGCRTTEGVGRDLERAGEEIQDEARDASR